MVTLNGVLFMQKLMTNERAHVCQHKVCRGLSLDADSGTQHSAPAAWDICCAVQQLFMLLLSNKQQLSSQVLQVSCDAQAETGLA